MQIIPFRSGSRWIVRDTYSTTSATVPPHFGSHSRQLPSDIKTTTEAQLGEERRDEQEEEEVEAPKGEEEEEDEEEEEEDVEEEVEEEVEVEEEEEKEEEEGRGRRACDFHTVSLLFIDPSDFDPIFSFKSGFQYFIATSTSAFSLRRDWIKMRVTRVRWSVYAKRRPYDSKSERRKLRAY